MTLYADLLGTELPDRAYLAGEIARYFPQPLRERYAEEIARHRLKREIVATWVANGVVNRGLAVLVSELQDETGGRLEEVLLAYVTARDAFGLREIWAEIEALPPSVPGERQTGMLVALRDVLLRGTRWFMTQGGRTYRIRDAVARFRPGIATILSHLDAVAGESHRGQLAAAAAEHVAAGVDADLARKMAGLPQLLAACDIVYVTPAGGTGSDEGRLLEAARLYFALDDALDLPWLKGAVARAPRPDRWHRLALTGIEDDLSGVLRGLTGAVMATGAAAPDGGAAAASVAGWLEENVAGLARYRALMQELRQVAAPDLPMLSVAVRMLSELLPRGVVG
jgi:glutamate dehydrogenase